MSAVCAHLDRIEVRALPDEIAGCEDCLALGDSWVHLRMCMTCGKIGCSTPRRIVMPRATPANPVIRSFAPPSPARVERCYVDEVAFVLERS